jgi:ATP-dependent Clp protease protease subunit
VGSPDSAPQTLLMEHLLDRRVVVLVGALDDAAALRVCAELMTLDASGSEPVELHMASNGERLDSALMVLDTLDLMQATVRARALGEVGGTAVAVFAACDVRTAAPHAGFLLREPTGRFTETTHDLVAQTLQQRKMLERFRERLARATGRSDDEIADDLRRSRYLDVTEACAYGLITGDRNDLGGAALPVE